MNKSFNQPHLTKKGAIAITLLLQFIGIVIPNEF